MAEELHHQMMSISPTRASPAALTNRTNLASTRMILSECTVSIAAKASAVPITAWKTMPL